MFLLLSMILSTLLAYLVVRWAWLRQYWSRRGVPHVPPNPITGSMSFLFKENCGIWMREIYQRFNTPYIGVWMFWQPALVINSPEIAKRILVKDFDYFRNRFLSSGKTDPIGRLNMFTANDPMWTSIRRPFSSAFSGAKLKALHNILVSTKTNELCTRITRDLKANKVIDLRLLFVDYATDIIGTSTFGITQDATLTGDSPIRNITRQFMEFNLYRGMCWTSIFFWPDLVDIFRFSLFPKRATNDCQKILDIAIKQRELDNVSGDDFLDILIKMRNDSIRKGEDFSDDLMVAQASVLLLGGFDTTGSALTYVVLELAHHSEIQEKIYNELIDIKANSANGTLDYNSLADFTYLNCVIKESLRKYPPMGWLDRIAGADYKIDDKLTIARGTTVYINASGMHYDPQYFPDPEVFNPDRFLPENEDKIDPFSYLPFGGGPRMCIGLRFALVTMRYALSEIVLRFKMRPLPGFPRPSELKYENKGLFLMPGEPLSVQFEPRQPNHSP